MTETDTRALVEQSQGWITSLRLTALAMRIHAEDARWFDLANAGFRDFSDYFSSELLTGLAPRTLFFLLRTSILDPLCGPLCDFVIAGAPGATGALEDSATLLRNLERMGAFTVALDDEGTWYRYHPLLREVLRRQLEEEMPKSEIAGLYVRAAAWHRGARSPTTRRWLCPCQRRDTRAVELSCSGTAISSWTTSSGAGSNAGCSSSRMGG